MPTATPRKAMARRSLDPKTLAAEIARLRDLDLAELEQRWANLFRCPAPKSLRMNLFIRSVAYAAHICGSSTPWSCRSRIALKSALKDPLVSRSVSRSLTGNSASEQETPVPPKCANENSRAANAFDVGQIRLCANGGVAQRAAKSRNVRRNSHELKDKNI